MKKVLYLIIGILFFPLNAFALNYTMKDLTISIDTSEWYTFTRDNIYNNSKLDELGISYEYMKDFFDSNDAYLDAIQYDENNLENLSEILVIIKKLDDSQNLHIQNLHVYDNSKIEELAEAAKNKLGADEYEIYSDNKYKYVYMEFQDQEDPSYNVALYYTVINGYGYNIRLQKKERISSSDYEQLRKIVDTASFELDPNFENKKNSFFEKAIVTTLVTIFASGIGTIFGINRKNKKNKDGKIIAKKIKVER